MRACAIARARDRAASSSCWLVAARGAAAADTPAATQAVSSSVRSTPASSATLMAARKAAKARYRGSRSLGVHAPVATVVHVLPCKPAMATGAVLGLPCGLGPREPSLAPSCPRAAKAFPTAANQPRTVLTAVTVPSCTSTAARLEASVARLAASSAPWGSSQRAAEPRMAHTVPLAMLATPAILWEAVAAVLAGECTCAVACSAPVAWAATAAVLRTVLITTPAVVCIVLPAELVSASGRRSFAPSSAGAACRFCRPALNLPAPASSALAASPSAEDMT
mmetsp:Transcript_86337/g.268264  ORF Transcript_86337/g.268264 Transcript_86337/m.268264 type:complete len:280 (+) Transcript_86337:1071-1910(+)